MERLSPRLVYASPAPRPLSISRSLSRALYLALSISRSLRPRCLRPHLRDVLFGARAEDVEVELVRERDARRALQRHDLMAVVPHARRLRRRRRSGRLDAHGTARAGVEL